LGLIFLPMWAGPGAILVLPGLTLLISPIVGNTIFELKIELTWAHLVSVAAQGVLAVIFLKGAIRKYVRPQDSGLGVGLGLLLLAFWTILSMLALLQWEDVCPAFYRGARMERDAQIIATLIMLMLLALVPLATAARD